MPNIWDLCKIVEFRKFMIPKNVLILKQKNKQNLNSKFYPEYKASIFYQMKVDTWPQLGSRWKNNSTTPMRANYDTAPSGQWSNCEYISRVIYITVSLY